MTEVEYQDQIPHVCILRTTAEHMGRIMLCWGITCGHVQRRQNDVEGPGYCHECEFSIKAKRVEARL